MVRSFVETARMAWNAVRQADFLYWRATNDFVVSGAPHLDAETLDVLTEALRRSTTYLEYGAGGSTVLAAREVAGRVITVESDRKFLAAVERAIDPAVRSKATLLYVDIGVVGRWGRPLISIGKTFSDYSRAPWVREPGLVPDLIFVDGRFRVACVLESLLHLPDGWEGRIILDDYVGRDHFTVVEEFVTDIKPIGRAISFRPGRFDRDRCLAVLRDHRDDWR